MFRDMGFATPVMCVVYLGERTTAVNSDRNSNAVRTHGIILRNAGKRTAYNVRIGHVVATASYQMYPSVSHKVEQGPNGSSEIVIPTLVPNEQITLSYLYFAPLYWNQVNSYTKSDEGMAKIINVIPSPQWPLWRINLLWALVFVGASTVLYWCLLALYLWAF